MSGEGPESIPVSADPRSKRPVKKRALTPVSAQASQVDALFARPDQEIRTAPPASSSSHRRTLAPPPEIVTNVQGSSAGAGSGEFHVYKASRRREYERLRLMDEEVARERAADAFERTKEEWDRRDDERTRKNREKRDKMKARKAKAKGKSSGGGGGGGSGNKTNDGGLSSSSSKNGVAKPRIIARTDLRRGGDDQHGETAQDTPMVSVEEPKGIVIEED
ncbi:DUF1168-domain-containing protein [Xylariomycetidae sp. FL2044]|nr:DUF1168-domain-containing protein [Xylariomycetidae sp. FL2044]